MKQRKKTYTLDSHDVSAIAKAPSVEFVFDGSCYRSEPPRATIIVKALSRDEASVHVMAERGLSVSVVETVSPEDVSDEHGPWVSALELACALYWSMWRRLALYDSEEKAGRT